MKKTLTILFLSLSSAVFACETAAVKPAESAAVTAAEKKEPATKEVCINVWDAKLNKEVKKCRTMKIHEKYEGTKVPPK
jgi:hypothetical protein